MIEIRRLLLGDRHQHAEAHLDVAFGIEQHHLLVRAGERQPEAKAGVAAHRRIAERCIEVRMGRELDPVAAAAAGNDDRVFAVGREGLQHVGGVHHLGASFVIG